jgi:ABC-type uncharacterized transport system fused permease/ATPase subunit
LSAYFCALLADTAAHCHVLYALQDQINLAWRGELTRRILRSYMSDGAYYTIELKHRDIDNPDQRATEDVEEVETEPIYCYVFLYHCTSCQSILCTSVMSH